MENETYYLLTFCHNWADEHDVPALACMTEKEFKNWKETKPNPRADLGNGGDEFEENFKEVTGAGYIKEKYVRVYKVDKSFHKIFHKADLASLSLSSVFTDELEEEEEEESDY